MYRNMHQSRYRIRRVAATRCDWPRSQTGYSMIELLVATGILLVVAVSILPLYSRALQSNLVADRASTMSTFSEQDMEEQGQTLIDHQDWAYAGQVCGAEPCVQLGTQYWTVSDDRKIGDEEWKANTSGGGFYLWEKTIILRKYSYADLHHGYIDVDTQDTVQPLGHPDLFDTPLAANAGNPGANVHLLEYRISIQPYVDPVFANTDFLREHIQQMTTGQFRAY